MGEPNMDRAHGHIGALFNILGHVSRDPNPQGFGYTYDGSIAERLGYVAGRLEEDGLSKAQVFARFLAASELSVVIRQHVETRLPDDNVGLGFN